MEKRRFSFFAPRQAKADFADAFNIMKTRECINCGNLTDSPGELLCERCRIKHSEPPKKRKVLLMDDDLTALKVMKQKLESTLLFDVITAYDGHKGFDKLQYEEPEIILVDVLMPLMNGHEFVEKLRSSKDPFLQKLPVIVLSDHKKMEKFFHPWDIQGFFVKPIDMKALYARMNEILPKSEKT